MEASGFGSSGTRAAPRSSPDLRPKASRLRDLVLVVIASSLLADHSEVSVEETKGFANVLACPLKRFLGHEFLMRPRGGRGGVWDGHGDERFTIPSLKAKRCLKHPLSSFLSILI